MQGGFPRFAYIKTQAQPKVGLISWITLGLPTTAPGTGLIYHMCVCVHMEETWRTEWIILLRFDSIKWNIMWFLEWIFVLNLAEISIFIPLHRHFWHLFGHIFIAYLWHYIRDSCRFWMKPGICICACTSSHPFRVISYGAWPKRIDN